MCFININHCTQINFKRDLDDYLVISYDFDRFRILDIKSKKNCSLIS